MTLGVRVGVEGLDWIRNIGRLNIEMLVKGIVERGGEMEGLDYKHREQGFGWLFR